MEMTDRTPPAPGIFIAAMALPVNPLMVRSAAACAGQVSELLSFGESDRFALEVAVEEAFSNAVRHFSRPADEDERVHLEFRVQEDSLVVSIRENGIPFDLSQADRYTPDTLEGMNAPGLGMLLMREGVDSVELFVHGREGKETRLRKKLRFGALPEELLRGGARGRRRRRPLVESAVMRPGTLDDLGEICRLAWRCYGYTQEELLYDLDLLTEKFLAGAYRPLVFFNPAGGEMIAHVCFKRHAPESGAPEVGLAFIDPAYKCPELSARMGRAVLEVSEKAGDRGFFDCSVTTHTASQRAMEEHCGARPCGLLLGIAAAGMRLKDMPTERQEKGSVLNHYRAFDRSAATIYAPPRHRAMMAEIYEWLELPRTFAEAGEGALAGESSVSASALPEELNAVLITVRRIGEATAAEVADAVRRCSRERRDAAYAFLPLGDASSPRLVEQCERIGLSFAGVMPHIHEGDDRILMQRVNVPLDAAKIRVYGARARKLRSYVLEERERVSGP